MLKNIRRWLAHPLHLTLTLLALIPLYVVLVVIYSYTLPLPFADQWDGSLPIALAIQRGEYPAQTIWEPVNGHRHIFMHQLTVISTLLWDWNPKNEAYITPILVLLNVFLIIRVFHGQAPHLTHWFLPLLTLCLYALYPIDLWLFSWNSAWQFAFLFVLLTFSVLYFRPPRPANFLLALLLASLASVSFGTGLLVWVLLPLVLWIRGYRQVWVYGLWLGLMGVVWAVYFSGGTSNGQFTPPTFPELPTFIRFGLLIMGSPLSNSGYELTWTTLAGGLVLGLVGVNLGVLWRRTRQLETLLPWLFLTGYALGMVGMIALTRFDPDQLSVAVSGRYSFAAVVLLVVLAALMLQNSTLESPKTPLLVYTNIIFGIVLLGAFFQANFAAIGFMTQDAGRLYLYYHVSPSAAEVCVRNFPRYQRPDCLSTDFALKGGGDPEQVYQLAAYRSTIFADEPIRQFLPPTYQLGNPVIIHTQSIWLNLFVRDSLLNFFPEDYLIHIAPPNTSFIPFPNPPPRQQIATLAELPTELLENSPTVWLIFTEQSPATLDNFLENYYPTPIPITDEVYRDSKFTLVRYDRLPETIEPQYQFEGLQLLAFALDTYQPAPCGQIRVQTWWQLTQPLTGTYSATLNLVNDKAVYAADGQIAGLPFEFWEPNRPYIDERFIQLPCEAPAEKYDLLLGLYDLNTVQDVTLTLPDGAPVGNRAYLTSLTVN